MLTGKELGNAIECARKLKGVTKVAMAAHFGLKPPSIQDWVKRGTEFRRLIFLNNIRRCLLTDGKAVPYSSLTRTNNSATRSEDATR